MDSQVRVIIFVYQYLFLVFNSPREIIRDNMLINMSGIDDQWMGVDMNIEHLINFLKVNIFTAHKQHINPLNYRWCSLRKEFMDLGIALVIFQLQVMSYVLPRSALAGS